MWTLRDEFRNAISSVYYFKFSYVEYFCTCLFGYLTLCRYWRDSMFDMLA